MATPESTRNLLLANAATAILAIALHWPLETVLWPYWIQSIVIGWYSRRRILAVGNLSAEATTANDSASSETPTSPRWLANFFALHFGAFHLFYLGFLLTRPGVFGVWDRLAMMVTAVSFVVTHRASFKQNLKEDAAGHPDTGTLTFLPYARVVPMHLAILFGANGATSSVVSVLLFISLKTGADVLMHHLEHRILQRGASNPAVDSGEEID